MRTIAAILISLTLVSTAAEAARQAPYSPSRFAEAQTQDQNILIDVRAAWCASCTLQTRALDKLEKNAAFHDLVVLTIDFALNGKMIERLRVTVPSTLILFKGRTEIARLTGQTDPKVIEAFFEGVSSRGAGVSLTSCRLAFIAGVLSIMLPCVLPLLPTVLAAAATNHHFGPVALIAAFVLFFVAIGLSVDTIGLGIGINSQAFRRTGAAITITFGLVLLWQRLPHRFEALMAPIQAAGNRALAPLAPSGLPDQFLIGALLGTVWSPWIGPTLGAAIALAAQGKSLGHATLTMFFFNFGDRPTHGSHWCDFSQNTGPLAETHKCSQPSRPYPARAAPACNGRNDLDQPRPLSRGKANADHARLADCSGDALLICRPEIRCLSRRAASKKRRRANPQIVVSPAMRHWPCGRLEPHFLDSTSARN